MAKEITIENSIPRDAIIINWSVDGNCFTVIPKNSIDFVCKTSKEIIIINDTRSMTPWDIPFSKVAASEYGNFAEMVTTVKGYIKT